MGGTAYPSDSVGQPVLNVLWLEHRIRNQVRHAHRAAYGDHNSLMLSAAQDLLYVQVYETGEAICTLEDTRLSWWFMRYGSFIHPANSAKAAALWPGQMLQRHGNLQAEGGSMPCPNTRAWQSYVVLQHMEMAMRCPRVELRTNGANIPRGTMRFCST